MQILLFSILITIQLFISYFRVLLRCDESAAAVTLLPATTVTPNPYLLIPRRVGSRE